MHEVRIEGDIPLLIAGLVEASGITVADSDDALRGKLDALIAEKAAIEWPDPGRKKAVRDLLRAGGFKPAGRNKPASEYLAGCAGKGTFPFVNNIVDSNNLVSLRTAFPISVIDLDRAAAVPGDASGGLAIRLGAPGESYVFNSAEQVIEVAGLVLLARAGGPALANPVKDSMMTKLKDDTTRVLGVIYASSATCSRDEMARATEEFASLLAEHAGARETQTRILPEEIA